jgi:hypothetical protein
LVVKIALGKFARTGIEELLGADLAVGVQAALTHYTRRLSSNWKPVPLPRFDWPSVDAANVFDLPVAPELEAALEREALEQQVSVDQILAHAVLVYLADLESATFSGEIVVAGSPAGDAPASAPAL